MDVRTENVAEAERSLTEKPLFATSVERIMIYNELKSEFKELPQPLRFSKILSIFLSRVSVPLEDYDLIAGRCVDRELTDEEEEIFQALIKHPDRPNAKVFLGSGHCTYSWDMVVKLGLPGMRRRAEETLAACEKQEKKDFMTAVIEVYDAIQAFMLRYADAAKARNLPALEANLRKAATERPDSFISALQLLWTITFIDCAYITSNPTLTVGRLDQILYPLYEADIKKGVLTREEAAEYITDYYCKHNLIMGRGEHQLGDASNSTTFDRICNFDAPQYLILAGTDENGAPAVNDLTTLFVECIRPKFKNPVVVVRYFKDMDKLYPELWSLLTQKALQSSSMMFYNDPNIIAVMRRLGLPIEDCRKYSHFGCNWATTGDNSEWMLGGPRSQKYDAYESEEEAKMLTWPYIQMGMKHGLPEDFMVVMRELAERDDGSVTIEDFYRLFFERFSCFVDKKLRLLSHELTVRQRHPSKVMTFGDCFYEISTSKAECMSAGAKYHFDIASFMMFGTVADCFIAVDQLVMREKKLTLSQLLKAVDANFEGYEDVLALCRGADKYGMDTELSNYHVRRLSHTFSDMVIEKDKPYFEKQRLMLLPTLEGDTYHLKKGEDFTATPDGRLAYAPFTQNLRPANGACVNGLTAMLNSVCQLPCDGLTSGALNLDVDAKQFEGEAGHVMFSALLAAYFNQGGLHAQVSCADINDLIDAQIHPERHRDLRVRVTGYSGVFVDICKRLQDDIIRRFQI